MALQTEKVDLTDFEEPRIGGTVGSMAGDAALGLHRHVLVDEGPLLVGVALVTNGVAAGERARLPHGRGSMKVMAVVALNQAFIYAMVKRFGKVALFCLVAAIT